MADVRIATRRSRLALAQTQLVAAELGAAHPGLEVEIVEVTTTGDRDRTTSVVTLTEVGAFVRAVQYAVLDGNADIAVHSGKDLPVQGVDGLAAVFPARAEPWDVLCGGTIDSLRQGATVGTGSPRRASQLRMLRPDVRIKEIRGNVETRLTKVDSGEYDAIVLAKAGLTRLGLGHRIDEQLTFDRMIPAAAQGALAVEAPIDSAPLRLLDTIDHAPTRSAVETERAVLKISQAGCRAALGVLAAPADSAIKATGFVEDERRPRRASAVGADPSSTARQLCERLEIVP